MTPTQRFTDLAGWWIGNRRRVGVIAIVMLFVKSLPVRHLHEKDEYGCLFVAESPQRDGKPTAARHWCNNARIAFASPRPNGSDRGSETRSGRRGRIGIPNRETLERISSPQNPTRHLHGQSCQTCFRNKGSALVSKAIKFDLLSNRDYECNEAED